MRHTTKQVLGPLATFIVLLTGNAAAQNVSSSEAPTRIPVTVAIADNPTFPGPFMVLRRAGETSGDVILIPARSASGENLSQAIYTLLAARRVNGDTAQSAQAFSGEAKAAPGRALPALPWAQRVANDLRSAPMLSVPGVGRTRAVQIWLPPQQKR